MSTAYFMHAATGIYLLVIARRKPVLAAAAHLDPRGHVVTQQVGHVAVHALVAL